MSEYTPETGDVIGEWVSRLVAEGEPVNGDPVTVDEAKGMFNRWLAAHDSEVERAAAEKALTDAANELSLLDDGGRRGLAAHSKSSASAITHRHAVAAVRARAAAYRREETE